MQSLNSESASDVIRIGLHRHEWWPKSRQVIRSSSNTKRKHFAAQVGRRSGQPSSKSSSSSSDAMSNLALNAVDLRLDKRRRF